MFDNLIALHDILCWLLVLINCLAYWVLDTIIQMIDFVQKKTKLELLNLSEV